MNKILIKLIPYVIIIIMGVVMYFWITSLHKDIDKLNERITVQSEEIKQYKEVIAASNDISNTVAKEQEELNNNQQQAEKEILSFNETIEEFVEQDEVDLVDQLNKYQKCVAAHFNKSDANCLAILK